MFVFGLDVGLVAEVDAYPLAHDLFSVENLADADGGVVVEERDDYPLEGFEGCP